MKSGPFQLEVNGNASIPALQTLLLPGGGPNNYANLRKGNAMRSTILALACGLGLVSASAALADQTQQPAPQPVSAASQDSNAVTCHMMLHEGEILRARECHTQHEWQAILNRNQEGIREFQLRGLAYHP